MAMQVVMPKFGVSMEQGVIARWLVKPGDMVTKGDPLAEVDSEKLTNNAIAPADGVVAQLLMQEGEEAPCGTPILILAEPGEAVADEPSIAPGGAAPPRAEVKITPRAKKLAEEKGIDYSSIPGTGIGGAITIDDLRTAQEPAPRAAEPQPQAVAEAAVAQLPPAEVKITPRARKYAQEKGLGYAHIAGTGLFGMVTLEDVKLHGKPAAAGLASAVGAGAAQPGGIPAEGTVAAPGGAVPQGQATVPPGQAVLMTQMQQAVARGMMQSLHNSAQSTLCMDAEVSGLSKLYASLKGKYQQAGVKLSYTAMILKAVAMTLEEHPGIRTQLADQTHTTTLSGIDLGVAVDVPGGLIVPVIRQANLKGLRTICQELLDVSNRAREGRLIAEDMGNAAMTVTNLGMFGVTYFTPILNPPESAILGVGAMTDQPVVKDGGIHIRPVMFLSLTYNHQIINGAPAARFLQAVIAALGEFRWM